MKKIMFIMILATIFIPIPQINAYDKGMNDQYSLKTNETQIMVKQELNKPDLLNNETLQQPEKIKRETRMKNISRHRERPAMKRISSSKRGRLFALLLLAHGGKK